MTANHECRTNGVVRGDNNTSTTRTYSNSTVVYCTVVYCTVILCITQEHLIMKYVVIKLWSRGLMTSLSIMH